MKETRLPEAEFAIMNYIWDAPLPVTSAGVMGAVGEKRGWKPQTCLTLVARLAERGYLEARRGSGREKEFYPLITRQKYLELETASFVDQVHGRSLTSLLASLSRENLTDAEITELEDWFTSMKKGE